MFLSLMTNDNNLILNKMYTMSHYVYYSSYSIIINKYLYSFILKKQGVFLSQNCEFDSHIEFHRCENDNEL